MGTSGIWNNKSKSSAEFAHRNARLGAAIDSGHRTIMGYQIRKTLGTGARSTIYEVVDPQSGQLYALKKIVRDSRTDHRFFEQTENEYKVSVRLNHPYLRRSIKLEKRRRWLRMSEMYLLMEYFDGKSLEQSPPHSLAQIVWIFTRAAEALRSMHEIGFAHADIKPNNILLGEPSTMKLIDFGQSCPLGTIKQRIQGTPDYIAPEQVRRQPIDARTDVFNLGATIYWSLMGKPLPTLISSVRPGRKVNLISDMQLEVPHEVNERIPPVLSVLVMNCVAKSPTKRPANMNTVLKRLEMVRLSETELAIDPNRSEIGQ